MAETVVRLKDGREFCGPIWEFNWRARRPYLTLVLDDAQYPGQQIPDRFYFDEMESCLTYGERVGVDPETNFPILSEGRDEIQRCADERQKWAHMLEKN